MSPSNGDIWLVNLNPVKKENGETMGQTHGKKKACKTRGIWVTIQKRNTDGT